MTPSLPFTPVALAQKLPRRDCSRRLFKTTP